MGWQCEKALQKQGNGYVSKPPVALPTGKT